MVSNEALLIPKILEPIKGAWPGIIISFSCLQILYCVRGFFAVGHFAVKKKVSFGQIRLGKFRLGSVRFSFYGKLYHGKKFHDEKS